jgi:hypothetical protein
MPVESSLFYLLQIDWHINAYVYRSTYFIFLSTLLCWHKNIHNFVVYSKEEEIKYHKLING